VTATIDPTDQVPEGNELNNHLSVEIATPLAVATCTRTPSPTPT
jgi:hypothetical protein